MVEQRRRGAWVRFWLVLAVAIAGLVVGCVLVFPSLLYPPLTVTELRARGVRDPIQQVQLQNNRLKLQNDARATLLQAVGGLLVVSTAGAGAYTAWRQLQDNRRQQQRNEELTREGQITERFTRAIEQLGNDKGQVDVTLGGIYALERIARDSTVDQATIAQVLTAYVRGHAPWPPTRPGQYVKDAPLNHLQPLQERWPDVQAALTVLGNMPSDQRGHIDLEGTDLRRANLVGAQLERANLRGAHLEKALLGFARLEGATLDGVHLEKADLIGVHLEKASLLEAHLEEASLDSALLEEANLVGVHLEKADLFRAHLEKAALAFAYLEGADLSGAHLRGAVANKKTAWPDGFDWQTVGVVMKDADELNERSIGDG